MSINGSELFGKDIPGNLSKQSLKKAKKKGEKALEKVIEANLPLLVEFYFTSFMKGNQREKYLKHFLQVIGHDAYFVRPLMRLLKKANKKKEHIEIPEGLHVILMDNLDEIRAMYRKKLKNMTGGNNNISDDTRTELEHIKEMTYEMIESTNEACGLLVRKRAKKLMKLGMHEEFAIELAKTYIPEDIMTTHNIRRYMYRTNIALYNIQRDGVTKNEDAEDEDDRWTQGVGLNLGDPDNIIRIYEILYKGMSRKVFINAMVGIMLERRGNAFNNFTKPQLWCYNAITTAVLDLLEGNEVINLNGDKLSKKDKKKLAVSKKELRTFMKLYSLEKGKDAKNNRDGARRTSFSSLSDDAYPKIVNAFSSYTREYFDTMWDQELDDPERRNNRNDHNNNDRDRNKNNQNNGNRDRDNRNNHDNRNNNNRR